MAIWWHYQPHSDVYILDCFPTELTPIISYKTSSTSQNSISILSVIEEKKQQKQNTNLYTSLHYLVVCQLKSLPLNIKKKLHNKIYSLLWQDLLIYNIYQLTSVVYSADFLKKGFSY